MGDGLLDIREGAGVRRPPPSAMCRRRSPGPDGEIRRLCHPGREGRPSPPCGCLLYTSIGEQGAKEAALAHAGLTEGDVVSLSVKREYDDGRLEYEVQFWVDTTEYEYTVDGATLSLIHILWNFKTVSMSCGNKPG